jgi:hypothetical protein
MPTAAFGPPMGCLLVRVVSRWCPGSAVWLEWTTRLDHIACEECGSALVVALLPDGTALCACCAAIRWRIPSADPVVAKAEISRRVGATLQARQPCGLHVSQFSPRNAAGTP